MNLTFRKDNLIRAIEAIVAKGGSDAREARMVAENLVTANLMGHDSHGIGMIPRYVESLLEGGLLVNQHPKIQLDRGAQSNAEKVSHDLLIDDRGNPTDDPRYGVVDPLGALRTFGLHKGYGLALACELLGGALSGGGTEHQGGDRSKKRVWNGMLAILIDPARIEKNGFFEKETGQFLQSLRTSPVAPGF